jgi:hypothetical protein
MATNGKDEYGRLLKDIVSTTLILIVLVVVIGLLKDLAVKEWIVALTLVICAGPLVGFFYNLGRRRE